MKKLICLLLAACMLFALASCGTKTEPAVEERAEWSRSGYFMDKNGNTLSVTWMELDSESGWFVAFVNGEDMVEDSYGGMLPQEGNGLHGSVTSGGVKGALTVTVTEEGDGGLQLAVEGGETYHFTPAQMDTAAFAIHINTEGMGHIAYAETEDALDLDSYFSSAGFGLTEPATYVFGAKADMEDWAFLKWTKNGEDFSTDPIITVELTESAEFVAVFDYVGGDGQNPAMNFVGEYASGRAHALVEAVGDDGAQITIEWGGSAWELARWTIIGTLDTDTLTVVYDNAVKTIVTYGDNGELVSEVVEYENGTGSIRFNDDGSFTWHDDQLDGEDMVFEWIPVEG